MSGAEHTNTDSAQFSGINPVVESSDSKGLSNFQGGGEGVPVPSSCFDSLGGRIPDYPNSVAVGEGGYGGDLGNWDVGACFGEGVNPFSSVGVEFGIVGTSVQGGGLPGMGNNIANGDAILRPDDGNVDAAEEDGSKGTRSGDGVSQRDSVCVMETTVEVPHSNDCYEAGKDGDKALSSNDRFTGGSLGHQEVENEGFEPEVVGRWDSIYEVAKQAEESAGLIPTSCDIPSHKSGDEHECVKSEAENPSGGLDNSVKPDIVSVSSTLVDKVVERSSELHTHKDELYPSTHDEEMEQKGYATSEVKQDNVRKEGILVTEQSEKNHHDTGKQSGGTVEGKAIASDEKVNLNGRRRTAFQEAGGQAYVVVFGIPATDPTVKIRPLRNLAMASASAGKRKPRQPSTSSPRVLRPKSGAEDHPNAPVPVANFENTQDSSAGRRGRKKREVQGKSGDEFSKIRKRLKYLLHRIAYERNLLDAYSSEGWRGQSIEKLRPEKELQRAKADINRSKLKIRELFHRLDSMSAEGKFPDSLYDSEGLIDSEDIFCAKCGSKDLPPGNDIILCDGNCDRGFHQYCLEPPLKTEEIPPGDEGWFCPACDCKFDCIDLLNDSQGAKLSIQATWEKIFPEAVEAMSGHQQDDIMGLPSDDSEDNDYNPDGQDDEDNREEGKATSSDESDPDKSDSSDFSSASEDLGAVCRDEQYVGLPSDDSEDNDFDPEGPDSNVDGEGSNSSSEFTSASEDLGATVGNDDASENEEHTSPVELDKDLDVSLPSSGRRLVEKLDYKKLYDETYGNADSDSSDDDEWTDDVATTRRKISAKREVSVSVDRPHPSVTPRRRGRPKRDCQVVDGSSVGLRKNLEETSSAGKSRKGLSYNRLSETVTQRLYESFNENQYPDRSTKEKLAGELGLTPFRVDKWFGNARWSLRHHPSRVEASIARVLPGSGTPHTIPSNGVEAGSSDNKITVTEHGGVDMAGEGEGEGISSLDESRKRKEADDVLQISQSEASKESETQGLDGINTSKESTNADPLQTPEALGRGQRKRRKSGAS